MKKLTENDIKRMGELQAIIDTATKELDTLKALAREDANGDSANFQVSGVTIAVSKPGKPTETLDTKAWQTCAPKDYARVFGLYHKIGSPRAAAVKVYINK